MLREKVDIKHAIDILNQFAAGTNGINRTLSPPTKESAVAPSGDGGTKEKKTLSPERANQLLEKVISFYEKTFADVPEGRQYLESRGITDAGLFSQHRIGYCNGTLTNILPATGTIRDELKELGILLDNNSERFTGCVVVPVFDDVGRPLVVPPRVVRFLQ